MPRCKVISHEGNGLYLVELQQDWSILDRKIADLTAIIDTLTPQISTAETVYNGLKAEFDALVDIQELALAELIDANNDPSREDERQALTDAVVLATNNAQKKRPAVQTAYQAWQILLVKKQQYQNKKTAYEANPRTNAQVNAQAVDKIDGTASEVLTGNYPVIAPDTFVDVYQLAREADTPLWYIPSALVHEESALPVLISPITLPDNVNGNIIADDLIENGAQFWNLAMLPGFQRWNPHIRKGVLEAKSGPTFTVRFSPIASSADFPLNGEDDTHDFTVDYFCGPTAFEVGDEVIVKIDNWVSGTPTGTVIGFADGPARECVYEEIINEPIQAKITLLFDPADMQGIGIYYYTTNEDGSEIIWLDELEAFRYATVRVSAISYNGTLVNASRGIHDIKISFDGGAVEQLNISALNKRLFNFIALKITPTEEIGDPRLTYSIFETDPDTVQFIEGMYGQYFTASPVFNPTGGGFSLINDSLTVNKIAGGTLIYHAASIQKIGSQFYLWYAP